MREKDVREKDVRLLMEISPERESLAGMMRGVEVQRTQTVKAGDVLWCKSYPIWDTGARKDAEQQLSTSKKKKGTTEEQKKLNARKAEEKMLKIINANFCAGDMFVTCTYAKDKQPEDENRANKDARNYISRLRRLCEKKGEKAPEYIYVTETIEKQWGREYHHHMIIKAAITREEAEKVWEKAGFGHANSRTVKKMAEGLIGLGKYMAKQVCSAASAGEYKNKHRWCASKGLKVPAPTEANKKISRRRVERIAEAMEQEPAAAMAMLGKCYPGYVVTDLKVKTSRWVTGAYVYAIMCKSQEKN